MGIFSLPAFWPYTPVQLISERMPVRFLPRFHTRGPPHSERLPDRIDARGSRIGPNSGKTVALEIVTLAKMNGCHASRVIVAPNAFRNSTELVE
jgi:hypothetical protein